MTDTISKDADVEDLSWRQRHHSAIRQVRLYARTFARNGSAMFGLALVLIFVVVAIIGPWPAAA